MACAIGCDLLAFLVRSGVCECATLALFFRVQRTAVFLRDLVFLDSDRAVRRKFTAPHGKCQVFEKCTHYMIAACANETDV